MAFATAMMAERPMLVRFAKRLCRDAERAEDLASEAITRAWKSRGRFEEGTNLAAWLCIILRNFFLSEQRRKRWDGGNLDDYEGFEPVAPASQEDCLHLADVDAMLALLPPDQREALIAIALEGTYEEAAKAKGVTLGTIKSRACRGRQLLKDLAA